MTLLYFILILGITIFIHELGHFIFAKKAGIYVYEFALGMGPRIYSWKSQKDETVYSIRLIPLGGFVQLAGESIDEDKIIPRNKQLQTKTWFERFLTIIAGAVFNFLFAMFLLFIIGLFYGVSSTKPVINDLVENYPAYNSGLQIGDIILEINNNRIRTWDDVLLQIELSDKEKPLTILVLHADEMIGLYTVSLKKEIENDKEVFRLGISPKREKTYGLLSAINYAVTRTFSLFRTMFIVIGSLFSGTLGLEKLTGPIGIYGIVGQQSQAGFDSILYLIAFLSINVGFINLIPFPAFDGGRLLFLVIEKVKGSPVNPKIENYFHTIGFVILMILMLYITFNDLVKLF